MISIRHKETRNQYRILAHYCSLIEQQLDNNNGIADVDRTVFDTFKNSNKLLRIEQLKQHILQQYNLAFFFALIIISLFTGLIVDYFTNHFEFCIVSWGIIGLFADIILLITYGIYLQCWKPYKKRQKQQKKKIKEELDEWRLKRAQNASNYCTFTDTLQENGIKSFVKDKAETIDQHLKAFNNLNKNKPIQRASASTLKLFELKKDLRYKYKYKKSFIDELDSSISKDGSESESYLEWSAEYKPSPLVIPVEDHKNETTINYDHNKDLESDDDNDGYLNYIEDTEEKYPVINNEHKTAAGLSPTTLIRNITKHRTPTSALQRNALLNVNENKYGNFSGV